MKRGRWRSERGRKSLSRSLLPVRDSVQRGWPNQREGPDESRFRLGNGATHPLKIKKGKGNE